MSYFTETFMTKQKLHFLNSLGRVEANVGTHSNPAWVGGEVIKTEIDKDGMAIFQFIFPDLISLAVDVSQIRIIDKDGEVASLMDTKISTARGQGVYETLKVDLFQNEVEVV